MLQDLRRSPLLLHAVTRYDSSACHVLQVGNQLRRQLGHSYDLFVDATDIRQVFRVGLVLVGRYKRSGRVQKLYLISERYPLLSARYSRSVPGRRASASAQSVHQGGFSAVGNAEHHSSQRLLYTLFRIPRDLVTERFFECGYDFLDADSLETVYGYDSESLGFHLRLYASDVFGLYHIGLVQDVNYRPLSRQF